jgi:hypothetical protein
MKITDNGNLIEDNQIPMTCEFNGCTKTRGKDYNRTAEEKAKGWEDEPIYLCDEHAAGRMPINTDKKLLSSKIELIRVEERLSKNKDRYEPEAEDCIDNAIKYIDLAITELLRAQNITDK